MANDTRGTRSTLIHCENCDEDYSATYKRCPFCGARPDRTAYTQATGRLDLTSRFTAVGKRLSDPDRAGPPRDPGRSRSRAPAQEDDYVFDGGDVFDDDSGDEYDRGGRRGGGKRLAEDDGGISPTAIAGFVFSAALIVAAILIILLVIMPMVRGGNVSASGDPNGSPSGGSSSGSPSPSSPSAPVGSDPTDPDPTGSGDDPAASPSDDPGTDADPNASPSASPSAQPAGMTLSSTDFTISDRWPDPVRLRATGAVGTVTWTSSNESVATVSTSGLVSPVGNGSATITATDSSGQKKTCRVIVSLSAGTVDPAPSESTDPSPAPSTSTDPSPAPSTSTDPSPSPSESTAPSGTLKLNKDDITISRAYPDPVQLRASGASGDVTWTSSNTAVATVDATGKVTRVGKGTCTITATDAAGNTAKCTVRCSD